MYPLPAVLVNCPATGQEQVRAALADNSVTVAAEFASCDDLLARWTSPPDVVRRLLVVRLSSLDDVRQLGRVDGCLPGWPVLALVEGECDTTGLFQASRAGAAQLVPLPFLREDFNAALDRLLVQFGLRSSPSRVVAVSGVSEGCGATSVAVGLAAELAAVGEVPCVLTELTFGLGRLAGLLDLRPTLTTRDLLHDPADPTAGSVAAALVRAGTHLSVLSGQVTALEPMTAPPGRVPQLLRVLRQAAAFVVVDLPYTFDPHYFEAMAGADEVVLVVRQDVPAVQAAKLLTHTLAERGLPAPRVVVNRYAREHSQLDAGRIGELLKCRKVYPVAADADGLRAAADAGKPLREVIPASPAVLDLRAVVTDLLEQAGFHPHLPRVTLWDRARTFLARLSA